MLIKFYVRVIKYRVKRFLGRDLDLLLRLMQSVSLPVMHIFLWQPELFILLENLKFE